MIIQRSSNRISIAAPAKINLFLELLAKRADGFHELQTVMSSVNLFDLLEFEQSDDDRISLRQVGLCGDAAPVEGMPTDESNLIRRALDLVRRQGKPGVAPCRMKAGMKVSVFKRIPSQAGMGGASSDAAAALIAANELWDLGLGSSQLNELAGQLGSDVPFFLSGGLALCTGRGEQVEKLNYRGRVPLVIAKPPEGIPTAEIYSRCQIPAQPKRVKDLLGGFNSRDLTCIGKTMFNRLEQFASGISEWIERLTAEFQRTDCVGHQLTGSGSCYFGVFPTVRSARRGANRLRARLPDVRFYCCHTLNSANLSQPNINRRKPAADGLLGQRR